MLQLQNGERRAVVQARGNEQFAPGEPVILVTTGGLIVAEGTPEDVRQHATSHTGQALREYAESMGEVHGAQEGAAAYLAVLKTEGMDPRVKPEDDKFITGMPNSTLSFPGLTGEATFASAWSQYLHEVVRSPRVALFD